MGRLEIVSAERVRDELSKLLVVEDPSPGLWFLVDTGIADVILPELPAMRVEQDPIHHHKDVLAHTIAVVAKTRPSLVVRMAALLHDVGKPKTRSIGPKGVSFHHHEVVGARMARERLRALRFPNEQVDDISQLVYLHLRFHGYGDDLWTDSAVRRYVRDAGPLLDDLNELTRCDCTTRNERKARMLAARMDALEVRIAELREREELEAIRPDLDGQAVMAHLGIPPGREVGEALAMLLEAASRRGSAAGGGGLPAPRRVVGRAASRERRQRDGQMPCLRARMMRVAGTYRMWSCHDRAARSVRGGLGLQDGVDAEVGASERGEQRADRAGHDAVGHGGVPVRAADPPLADRRGRCMRVRGVRAGRARAGAPGAARGRPGGTPGRCRRRRQAPDRQRRRRWCRPG